MILRGNCLLQRSKFFVRVSKHGYANLAKFELVNKSDHTDGEDL
jgi:hypothetical protein